MSEYLEMHQIGTSASLRTLEFWCFIFWISYYEVQCRPRSEKQQP
jgi:hypothetical protein